MLNKVFHICLFMLNVLITILYLYIEIYLDFFIEYIKMIASLDILRNAKICIGSYTTNPGMFLGIRMYNDSQKQFLDVDGKDWFITIFTHTCL